MCGVESGVQIIPFRGEYYDLLEHRRGLVKDLIYPVPDARYPFLGCTSRGRRMGRSRRGRMRCSRLRGTDTHETSCRRRIWGAARVSGILEDGAAALADGRDGNASFDQRGGVCAGTPETDPEIRAEDVTPGRAGIRAQALDENGKLLDDFRLVEGEGMLHVLNAPSPAATASLAIGRSLADSAARVFRPSPRVAALAR